MSHLGIHTIKDRAVEAFTHRNPSAAFDPATIGIFIELIMGFIAALQDCKKTPEEAALLARNPTWLQKRFVSLKVRRDLGRRGYRSHGKDMVASLVDAGKGTNALEVAAAYDDADNS